jgi:protein O-GlcNAc transferase
MAQLTIQDAFESAMQHHRGGRLQQAERLYRQILAHQPNHAGALHFLGVIASQAGRNDVAVDLIRRAIALRPDWPEAYNNLGNALRASGQLDEAIAACRQAIAFNPDSPEAHYNLGNALSDKGQLDEAIAAYRRAVTLDPSHAFAHNNLGNALKEKGQYGQAIASFRRALVLQPRSLELLGNLGNALKANGQLDEATAAYRQVIAVNPNFPHIYNNLSVALKASGQLDEAIATCRQAITLQPNSPVAHNNLGNALHEKGQLDEAITAYRQAIALQPNFPEAHYNVGISLQDNGQLGEAIAAYRRAIALKPSYAQAHGNLGNALRERGELDEAIAACHRAMALNPNSPVTSNNLGNALKDQGRLDEAIAAYRQAICLKRDFPEAHSNLLYTLHFHPGFDSRQILAESREWSRKFADALSAGAARHENDRSPGRRLRIGYVSPDFRRHPVGRFLAPVLAHHDRGQFEVFCYSGVRRPDHLTERLRRDADHWRQTTGSSDQALAEQVRHDRIDLLVDLTMHMTENRLLTFARRPAPVQVTWLAYAGTTGLTAIDYRLSDPYLDPPGGTQRQVPPDGAQPHDDGEYAEQTIRLPRCYWCYEPGVPTPDVSPLPALEAGHVTFGCLNNFCKATAPTLQLWALLLQTVPRSRLLIHGNPGAYQQGVRRLFSEAGVSPERLEFIAFQPVEEYLRQHHRVDIALDPFPYGGGTTTCDSLWMGVPVVTLAGRTAVGRSGVSLLSNLGLTELIAATPEQYLAIAAAQAADLPSLARLRSGLRPRMRASALMDGPAFTAGLEAAFREMWRRWCATPAARSVRV